MCRAMPVRARWKVSRRRRISAAAQSPAANRAAQINLTDGGKYPCWIDWRTRRTKPKLTAPPPSSTVQRRPNRVSKSAALVPRSRPPPSPIGAAPLALGSWSGVAGPPVWAPAPESHTPPGGSGEAVAGGTAPARAGKEVGTSSGDNVSGGEAKAAVVAEPPGAGVTETTGTREEVVAGGGSAFVCGSTEPTRGSSAIWRPRAASILTRCASTAVNRFRTDPTCLISTSSRRRAGNSSSIINLGQPGREN